VHVILTIKILYKLIKAGLVVSMKMEKYGCRAGSLVMIILVAALLLSLPLLMGPLQPPPASILLIFAVLFVAILIFLHQAST
jgi:hypothetical protein